MDFEVRVLVFDDGGDLGSSEMTGFEFKVLRFLRVGVLGFYQMKRFCRVYELKEVREFGDLKWVFTIFYNKIA